MINNYPGDSDEAAWGALASRALQLEMLSIDERAARDWCAAMRRLVAQQLDHAEFTQQRMDALRDWTRARKLAQTNVRFRFNTARRSARLIRRDVRAALDVHAYAPESEPTDRSAPAKVSS